MTARTPARRKRTSAQRPTPDHAGRKELTPWELLLGCLALLASLIIYLLPIIIGVGSIVGLGFVFGDDGLLHQRRTERAYTTQDRPALQALPPARQEAVLAQLIRLKEQATLAHEAAVDRCDPSRVPHAHATLRELQATRRVLPAGPGSIHAHLDDLEVEIKQDITECRVPGGRSNLTTDSGFLSQLRTLEHQITLVRATVQPVTPTE